MKKIRDFIYYILLAHAPSLFAHPVDCTSFVVKDQTMHWIEDEWNKTLAQQIANHLMPLYYCKYCGELVSDMRRHLPHCPGKNRLGTRFYRAVPALLA